VPALPGSGVTPDVRCVATSDGWSCQVAIRDGEAVVSSHSVAVSRADLARLDPGPTAPDDLVRRSFEFLLEREPPSSILSTFELSVISRYFPGYEADIRRP
jgi:hypothetical protein